jgi:hypothetical protein
MFVSRVISFSKPAALRGLQLIGWCFLNPILQMRNEAFIVTEQGRPSNSRAGNLPFDFADGSRPQGERGRNVLIHNSLSFSYEQAYLINWRLLTQRMRRHSHSSVGSQYTDAFIIDLLMIHQMISDHFITGLWQWPLSGGQKYGRVMNLVSHLNSSRASENGGMRRI